ncbi:MAG: hypothetical protein KKG59_01030 [Nanoarchaeota archaeon]|nr:hypothetical protein [Nanoarchaeota archaeon]
MSTDNNEVNRFRAKYQNKLNAELGGPTLEDGEDNQPVSSRHYEEFRETYMPKHLSRYEAACNISEKILNLAPDKKTKKKLDEAIKNCHLNITSTGANSFSYLVPLGIMFVGLLFGFLIPFLLEIEPNTFIVLISLLVGAGTILPLQKLPFIISNSWRLKASNQMVLCVFYVVTYMRHTSNLELAMDFAAEHLSPPLSLDLKKIIWNIETEKYGSIKESIDNYLVRWRETNMEFVEAMHLIESSLYESAEARRLTALDKSLEVMLSETYEKMLHYAHQLKNPLTTLHMMGIILPILGLVILPLATNFMEGITWYHIFVLYNIILPLIVFYYSKSILSTRPTGYGAIDISQSPEMRKKKNIVIPFLGSDIVVSPAYLAVFVFGVLLLIGLVPLLIHGANPNFDCVYAPGYSTLKPDFFCATEFPADLHPQFSFLSYQPILDIDGFATDKENGPFGIGAAVISLFLTLSFGLGFGLFYKLRTAKVMKIRDESKKLEKEFASALFQLGNRLGDGLPAEIAFSKVANVMEGTASGDFFGIVSANITKLGLGMEDAIFNRKNGALINFPSNLIESSMKVLLESSKKGPLVASQALINVSEYIKEMHRVDERLKDLMADIVGSMKSQINFLTPAIAGIVVGITSLITKIMIVLSSKLSEMGESSPDANYGSVLTLLGGGNAIPAYHFQAIVGLYVVQIIFCLTILVNGIENGDDKLMEKYLLGANLVRGTILYVVIAFAIMMVFSSIAGGIVTSIEG